MDEVTDQHTSSSPRHPTGYPVPPGASARRLTWELLPPHVRREVERRVGGRVVEAHSQDAGFTPGLASVLVTEDGSRHFVKAASVKAQRVFAEAYREEARKLAALPAQVPAPRLRWLHDADGWVVLGIEHVEARRPARPWVADELDACLDALAVTAAVLTPPPTGVRWTTLADDLAELPTCWDALRTHHDLLPHLDEAAELAAGFARHTAGETLVHTDVRDDNLLIAPEGRVLLCDWNWPVVGAAWIDSLLLLVGPRGDGIDVGSRLTDHPTFAGVAAEAVDALLALVTGYFLRSADQPVPSSSPWVREHQQWQGEVCWRWLGERRGWADVPE